MFRAVLRIHPRSWRGRYLDEATEAFAAGLVRRWRESGPLAAQGYALRAVIDAFQAGWRERLGAGFGRAGGGKRPGWTWILDGFHADLRYALRGLRRNPICSLGVVLTLALGIGANATMFGIVDRLLLSPPTHVMEPDQVHRVYLQRRAYDGRFTIEQGINYPDFTEFQTIGAFAEVAVYHPTEYTVGAGLEAQRVMGTLASWELFPLLGVTPHIGHFFSAEEDRIGAPITAVLGYGFWQQRFGGDPSVLGRTLSIDGTAVPIIGVAPQGFTGIDLGWMDIWLPLRSFQTVNSPAMQWVTQRNWFWLHTVVRMSPDASLASGEEEATALYLGLREDQLARGQADPDDQIVLGSLIAARGPRDLREGWAGVEGATEPRIASWLAGLSVLVLLIACANVANQLLARAVDRNREVAVRLAFGVSRRRLAWQLILETLVLAAFGGAAALALARWGGAVIRSTLLPDVPWVGAGLEGRVLGFTVVVTLLAGIAAALLPSVRIGGTGLSGVLGSREVGASPRRSRMRRSLQVFQVTFSVVLLVCAGLFVESLRNTRTVDLGLERDQVALVKLEFDEEESGLEGAEANRRCRMVADRLAQLPGVTHTALASVPFGAEFRQTLRVPELDSLPEPNPGGPFFQVVDADYFSAMGIRVLEGRSLTHADQSEGARVLLVNEAMARTLWPQESALGKCILFGSNASECVTVVGVVEDVAQELTEDPVPMTYYVPLDLARGVEWGRDVYVRFTTDPQETLGRLRREAVLATPGVRFAEVSTLSELLDPQARSWRLGATLFGAFGLLALLVAGIGLYSVLAFTVARRTRELGLRVAVGGTRGSVFGMVIRDGTRLTIWGLLLGVALALVTGFLVEPLLFHVSPLDPTVFTIAVLTLLLVSVAASAIPAWHAGRIDPAEALRTE